MERERETGLRLHLVDRRLWWDLRRLLAVLGRQLLFPSKCVGCGAAGHVLCPTCLEHAATFVSPRCSRCDSPLGAPDAHLCSLPPSLDMLRVVGPHTGILRRAVHALKYEGRTDTADPLGLLLAARWTHVGERVDGLIPVPLGAQRLAERGYNQAEHLAREMARELGLGIYPAFLQRVRETRPQVGLTREERLQNVAGAFQALPDVEGGCWLLVDDVCTTGATLGACAAALKARGARRVCAITLTRAADGVPVTPLLDQLENRKRW